MQNYVRWNYDDILPSICQSFRCIGLLWSLLLSMSLAPRSLNRTIAFAKNYYFKRQIFYWVSFKRTGLKSRLLTMRPTVKQKSVGLKLKLKTNPSKDGHINISSHEELKRSLHLANVKRITPFVAASGELKTKSNTPTISGVSSRNGANSSRE